MHWKVPALPKAPNTILTGLLLLPKPRDNRPRQKSVKYLKKRLKNWQEHPRLGSPGTGCEMCRI
jgi:hypothetical protein